LDIIKGVVGSPTSLTQATPKARRLKSDIFSALETIELFNSFVNLAGA
jgi:hypothetical protein